jgi:hypothetical protein
MAAELEEGEEVLAVISVLKDGKLKVQLQPHYEDPVAWGIGLCDLARHLAKAYSSVQHRNEEEILGEIVHMFNCELEKPTSGLTGNIIQ